MNISFKGIIHITGPKKEVYQAILERPEEPNEAKAIHVQGNIADALILTQQDSKKYLKKHYNFKIPVPDKHIEIIIDHIIKENEILNKLLRNYILIKEYFEEQKANGTEIEEIKL